MSHPRIFSRLWRLCGVGLTAAALGAACSATQGNTFTSGNEGGAGNGNGNGSGAGLSTGTGGAGGISFTSSGTSMSTGPTDPDAGCAGQATKAQQIPLDMFIMLDQSGSMSDTTSNGQSKWQAVTGALASFLQQPGLGGISVGIQYFGQDSCACVQGACPNGDFCLVGVCYFCTLSSGGGDSCDPAAYAKPEVEIAPLPGVAQQIITSMGGHGPLTGTPTAPALQGAIDHATAWAKSHPDHVVIAVLATDGLPGECSPTDAAGLAQIAAGGVAATPSIKTFAIGVFADADKPAGPDLMDQIAAGGGTMQAFNIDTSANVNQAFLDALNMIRGTALGCSYSIPVPQSGTPDYTSVNVQYKPGGGGQTELFPQVQSQADCPSTGSAWYYDNPSAPTQILLCPGTCDAISADQNGEIDVVLGCKTVIK